MSEMDRYARQVIFSKIREQGQQRLLATRVVQVGCGALGSTMASLMVRAGIGHYTIIDRDRAELHNLQRQTLFDEEDVKRGTPKAVIAAEKLRKMNSQVTIRGEPATLDRDNIAKLVGRPDLVMDATDNMETRFLLNEYCVREGIPWIYGGVVGASGMTMNIIPGEGPCLKCVFSDTTSTAQLPSVSTVGILNSTPTVIAAIQVSEAIKLLLKSPELTRGLTCLDLWRLELKTITVARDPSCRCCGKRDFVLLEPR